MSFLLLQNGNRLLLQNGSGRVLLQAVSANVSGSGSLSFGSMTCAGSGTRTNPVFTATGSPTLQSMICAGVGVKWNSGSGSASLGSMTCAGSGTIDEPIVSGTGTCVLGSMICNASGIRNLPSFGGSGAVLLESMICAGSASAPMPTMTGAGEVVMGSITALGSGVVTGINRVGSAAISLGSMLASGIGIFISNTIIRYWPIVTVSPVRDLVTVDNTRPVAIWRGPMSTVILNVTAYRSEDVRIPIKIHPSIDISDWDIWQFAGWVFNSDGDVEIEATPSNGRVEKVSAGRAVVWFKKQDNENVASMIGNKYQIWRTDTDESFPLVAGKYKIVPYERPS